jgi:hypothetical protein
MTELTKTEILVNKFLEFYGFQQTEDPGLLKIIKNPKLTNYDGIKEYVEAISEATSGKVFNDLVEHWTMSNKDDYTVAQMVLSQFLTLFFTREEFAEVIKSNENLWERITQDFSVGIKSDMVYNSKTLLAWARLVIYPTILPKLTELYGRPERPGAIRKPKTAAQIRKEKKEELEIQEFLEKGKPQSDSEEEEIDIITPDEPVNVPVVEEEPVSEPEVVIEPVEPMDEEEIVEEPVRKSRKRPLVVEEVPVPEEEPYLQEEVEEEEEAPKKTRKSKKKVKFAPTPLDVEDWIVAMRDIELKPDSAEPVVGFAKAVKQTLKQKYRYVRASDFDFGYRIWGARIYPKLEFLKSGRTKLLPTDIARFGKFGVQEVNSCGNTAYRIKDETFDFSWVEEKRWLNLSSIVEAIRSGSMQCELQRNNPFIGPKGCVFAKDYRGVDIDENGNKMYDVNLEEDDYSVLRKATVGHIDKSTFVECMVDTGARRNEISAKVAKALGLYNPDIQAKLGVTNSGEVETTTGVYRVKNVNLFYNLDVKDLFHGGKNTKKYPKDASLQRLVAFEFPEDPKQDSNFECLIGRDGIRKMGFRVYVK